MYFLSEEGKGIEFMIAVEPFAVVDACRVHQILLDYHRQYPSEVLKVGRFQDKENVIQLIMSEEHAERMGHYLDSFRQLSYEVKPVNTVRPIFTPHGGNDVVVLPTAYNTISWPVDDM